MARMVVLGADGFIGTHLVKKLSSNNDNEVIAFDRFSDFKLEAKNKFKKLQNVSVESGNFFNQSDLNSIIKKDDYVFHLISTTNPASSNSDPFIDIETNIKGSVELFDICASKQVKKIIFLSSGGTVYGNINSDCIKEETVPMPISPYGIGKLTIENYLRYFKHNKNLDYIVYRVANPYGPGQNIFGKQGVIPIFMQKFLNNEPIDVFGDGSMIRDYLYISDLIESISNTFHKNNTYSEYNIGSGEGKSVLQIINTIEDVLGVKLLKNYQEAPASYVSKSVLDNTRFIKEFGIKPKIKLHDGINMTWNYVKSIKSYEKNS